MFLMQLNCIRPYLYFCSQNGATAHVLRTEGHSCIPRSVVAYHCPPQAGVGSKCDEGHWVSPTANIDSMKGSLNWVWDRRFPTKLVTSLEKLSSGYIHSTSLPSLQHLGSPGQET